MNGARVPAPEPHGVAGGFAKKPDVYLTSTISILMDSRVENQRNLVSVYREAVNIKRCDRDIRRGERSEGPRVPNNGGSRSSVQVSYL